MLADGSEVSTGGGGRLIVGAPGRHISVGPDSRFVLPHGERDNSLEHRAGWLRYRIAAADGEPFRIHTRSLELELLAGVVDVHVNHLETEVAVKEGQVRVATPDGLRQTQMLAGQSAQSGGPDEVQLAVRRAPGAPLQQVDQAIVPALQPRSTPFPKPRPAPGTPSAGLSSSLHADPAPAARHGRAPGEAPLVLPYADGDEAGQATPPPVAAPQPFQAPPGVLGAAAVEPGARDYGTVRGELVRPGAPAGPAQVRGGDAAEDGPAALRRSTFERLTAGMLDEVDPRRHPAAAPVTTR
jgi:hypothetical protein